MSADKQHHIKFSMGDVARFVLLPGDPARTELIVGHFEDGQKNASTTKVCPFRQD